FTASAMAFIWPKVFFDFLTKRMDVLISPIPYLQVINLFLATLVLAWEWPMQSITGSPIQQCLLYRLILLPPISAASCLMYQGGDVAIYYLISFTIYWWAYTTGERRVT
ncbi:hypothetical protein B0J18DRAFT_374011, partial [Chaetomium sp. MPI-SDFR-AT-0129]